MGKKDHRGDRSIIGDDTLSYGARGSQGARMGAGDGRTFHSWPLYVTATSELPGGKDRDPLAWRKVSVLFIRDGLDENSTEIMLEGDISYIATANGLDIRLTGQVAEDFFRSGVGPGGHE